MAAMPTQRPFFANFFSAFRMRTSPTFQAKSGTLTGSISPSTLSASAHVSTTTTTVTTTSTARTMSTKHTSDNPSQNSSTNAIAIRSTSPFAAAAINAAAGSPGSHLYGPHLPKSNRPPSPGPNQPSYAMSPPGGSSSMSRGRQRRGSDSSNSSGGFMENIGPEKWYIGGRTVAGDDRYYRLGLATANAGRRVRSVDRLSL